MKKALVFGAVILILIFAFLITYSLYYFQNSGLNLLERSTYGKSLRKPYFHFAIIAQNTDDAFWQTVKKGSQAAADAYNVSVEFNAPRFTNIDEELQYFNIAIASTVDGIVTHVLDEKRFTPLINKATDANIPVVTIETDAKNSKRKSFIGTNSVNIGSEAGRLVIKATKGTANVAVILNNYGDGGENVSQNLRVAGFKDATSYYPQIKIQTIKTSSTGLFSAEEVTRNILYDYPQINTIICTSSKDTISVAQIIVDLNKVGQINIIGYGDAPEILRYVEKGVIFGTVVGNPYKSGYESIRSLLEIKKNEMTSSYVDTGVGVVTAENLKEYKANITENDK